MKTRNWPDIERFGFYLTLCSAGLLFQITPHLPMVDIPQHAAQISLLKDILNGGSPWAKISQVNYLTPYIFPMMTGLGLSYIMPVASAVNLLLSISFYFFVLTFVSLRKELGADKHLDWLFIPSFFGFSFKWGLFSFLVTSPIGVAFILLAYKNAKRPDRRKSIYLTILNFVLLASHALIYAFANLLAGLISLTERKWKIIRPMTLTPFLAPIPAVVSYFFYINSFETSFQQYQNTGVIWRLGLERIGYPLYALSMSPEDLQTSIFSVFFIAIPLLSGFTLHNVSLQARIPILTTLAVGLFAPFFALKTSLLYPRFALFLLPSYAICLNRREGASRNTPTLRCKLKDFMLPLTCCLFISTQTIRLLNFKTETKDIDEIIRSLHPGERALSLIFNIDSEASHNNEAYLHYPLWYQAEKQGFVDFNFAQVLPSIVRFNVKNISEATTDLAYNPTQFNWIRHKGYIYRYFFIRSHTRIPDDFFANQNCAVKLIRQSGMWSIYESSECQ